MGRVTRDAFVPDERRADAYEPLYEDYTRLHDHFGRGGDDVLHELGAIRSGRELANA
jgi:L-ribulokinase